MVCRNLIASGLLVLASVSLMSPAMADPASSSSAYSTAEAMVPNTTGADAVAAKMFNSTTGADAVAGLMVPNTTGAAAVAAKMAPTSSGLIPTPSSNPNISDPWNPAIQTYDQSPTSAVLPAGSVQIGQALGDSTFLCPASSGGSELSPSQMLAAALPSGQIVGVAGTTTTCGH